MIIKEISDDLRLDINYLKKLIKSASHHYRVYKIPKRKGGFRLISHPSKELKILQRWIIENVFNKFNVHESVFSYRQGISIKNLAVIHRRSNFLLRTDFNEFFPSINSKNVKELLLKNLSYINMTLSEKDIEIICKIVCKDGKLTIGAPSSPSISNAILYDFDKYWFEKCQKEKILYSRYADDLYFTTNYPNKLNSVYQELIEYLSKMKSPILKLNKDKTIFTSKKHKRIITGLVLTSTEDVSVGRKKKRHIKMLVHKYCEQTIEETELKYLKGYLSFVNSVEPSFLERLRDKYGKDVITHILPLKPNNH